MGSNTDRDFIASQFREVACEHSLTRVQFRPVRRKRTGESRRLPIATGRELFYHRSDWLFTGDWECCAPGRPGEARCQPWDA